MALIYRCIDCGKTSFETECPWCPAAHDPDEPASGEAAAQIPLDPAFLPEFQYRPRNLLLRLLLKRRNQARLDTARNNILQKYARFRIPYFANFIAIAGPGEAGLEIAALTDPAANDNHSDTAIFREILVRKGFAELRDAPELFGKLLLTTRFSEDYRAFCQESAPHVRASLRETLKSWIAETGPRFRNDLCLFLYVLWSSNIRHPDLPFNDRAATTYGTPLLPRQRVRDVLDICEAIHLDLLVQRLDARLVHFDPDRTVSIAHVDAMNTDDFEKFLAALFRIAGFEIDEARPGGDRGSVMFGTQFGKRVVIHAISESASVAVAAVQDAISARNVYACDDAIVVTNAYFTKSATDLANAAAIRLIDRVELQNYLDEYNLRITEAYQEVANPALA